MSPRPAFTLSLKSRLGLVAAIALVLGLLPSSLLLRGYAADLDFVTGEQRGLPLNEGWQQVLQQLQQHRLLAAETLSTRPDARPELAAAQAAMRAALQQLERQLDPAAADTRQRAVSEFAQGFAALQAELAAGKLDVARTLARHQTLAGQAFNAIAAINGDTGLALDPDPGSHFAIMAGLQAAPRVKDALSELGSIARAAAVDDQAAVASALTRYREHASQMQQQMQAARSTGGAMAQELDAMLAQAVKQRQLVDQTMHAATQDVNYPLDELGKSFSTAAALQDELSSHVLAMLKTELARRADAAALKRNLLLLLMPSLLGLLSLLLWRATRQLLVPVAQMVSVAERIAAGDLSQPVPRGRGDELGRVLQALAHMQQRLRQLIEQIHSGAGSIRVAAHEIAAGNQDLAMRTEQAAAQLQQTASGVDMLDTVVQASTQAVDQATRLAQEASGVADSGGQVVQQVVGTMAAIHESSRRITDIIGLIDGLAFQTNILALNAAVEAARAGEQGRGFAVVAAEVRSLAGRSAQAAKEIKALIQQSVERVESGTGLANDAGASMRQILGKVQAVSEVIANITAQAKVQADQTIELGRAVRNIDAMTQQNAALVEQSAASAQSLHGQAASMDQTVQAFRL